MTAKQTTRRRWADLYPVGSTLILVRPGPTRWDANAQRSTVGPEEVSRATVTKVGRDYLTYTEHGEGRWLAREDRCHASAVDRSQHQTRSTPAVYTEAGYAIRDEARAARERIGRLSPWLLTHDEAVALDLFAASLLGHRY